MSNETVKLDKSNDINTGFGGLFRVFVLGLSIIVLLSNCFEETFVDNPNLIIELSRDTIRFDTVFFSSS